MVAQGLQGVKDTIVDNDEYRWFTFSEEDAQELGYETRAELIAEAAACDELEVNTFYCAARFKTPNRVRPVEVGRVVVVTYGKKDYGKTAVITDIVDQARVVLSGVDGQLSDIKPGSYPIRRLHMTATRVPGLAQRGHRTKKVKALLAASFDEVSKSIMTDRTLQKIQKRQAKTKLNDFDRFKAWATKKGLVETSI